MYFHVCVSFLNKVFKQMKCVWKWTDASAGCAGVERLIGFRCMKEMIVETVLPSCEKM